MSSANLERRALAAWFRAGGAPDRALLAGVKKHKGKRYVVLGTTRKILAVFRVRAFDGVLKRLKRWPKEIES
jgi:hypothetical protein